MIIIIRGRFIRGHNIKIGATFHMEIYNVSLIVWFISLFNVVCSSVERVRLAHSKVPPQKNSCILNRLINLKQNYE